MAKLGEDVTQVLDYVPGYFQVIRHVRPKYACTACDAITQAPAPAMPTPRGRATPGTLAHLLVSKYCDHLPLYRQSEIYAREGLDLDRSTLSDWVGQAAWLLDPVVAGIRRHVFAGEKIHGDDTTVPVLAPGLGRTKTGRLWVYVRDDRPFCGEAPPAAAYFYSPDRGGEHPGLTWPHSPVCSRPMGMPDSRRCTVRPAASQDRSPKLPAGCTADGRSSMFGTRRNRRSPRRRSIGSPRSM
jgi:transposase